MRIIVVSKVNSLGIWFDLKFEADSVADLKNDIINTLKKHGINTTSENLFELTCKSGNAFHPQIFNLLKKVHIERKVLDEPDFVFKLIPNNPFLAWKNIDQRPIQTSIKVENIVAMGSDIFFIHTNGIVHALGATCPSKLTTSNNNKKIKEIFSTGSKNYALCENGEIYVCGNNRYDPLGFDSYHYNDDKKKLIETNKPTEKIYEVITTKDRYTFIIYTDETNETIAVYFCNRCPLFLQPSHDSIKFTKVKMPNEKINKFVAGGDRSFIICESKEVYALCEKYLGKSIKVIIPNKTILNIFAGNHHAFFICTDGTVYACGHNEYGQLGLGHNKRIKFPTKVNLPNKKIHKIIVGNKETFVIYTNREVYTCGCNEQGQLWLNDTKNRNTFTLNKKIRFIFKERRKNRRERCEYLINEKKETYFL